MSEAVGVIGLGYIGLPLVAACSAYDDHVIGFDIDKKKIRELCDTCEAKIYEPGLNELLKQNRSRIEFTDDLQYFMGKCGTIIITVGTPLTMEMTPDLGSIENLVPNLGKYLRKSHLIVLKSTIYPGITRKVALQLQEMSGLKAGEDFFVAFCPERSIEGHALYELNTLPKIIAGVNKKSTAMAVRFFERFGAKIIAVSSLEVAEMCKLVDNTYRAVNINFANEVGMVCEKVGIDACEVINTVNDAYMRNSMFLPGTGADGPCLSKDPSILSYYARMNKAESPIVDSGIKMSRHATLRVAHTITDFVRKSELTKPVIALIGLAFKGNPPTDDIREAPSVKIYQELKRSLPGASYKFCDPLVHSFMNKPVSGNMNEVVKEANVIAFLSNHYSIMNIASDEVLSHSARPLLVIDCWHNIKDPQKLKKEGIEIFRIGDGTV